LRARFHRSSVAGIIRSWSSASIVSSRAGKPGRDSRRAFARSFDTDWYPSGVLLADVDGVDYDGPQRTAVGDVDGDGKPDVVTIGSSLFVLHHR
jgi:hypothetical protein